MNQAATCNACERVKQITGRPKERCETCVVNEINGDVRRLKSEVMGERQRAQEWEERATKAEAERDALKDEVKGLSENLFIANKSAVDLAERLREETERANAHFTALAETQAKLLAAEQGPPGTDRRWKLAAEQALGVKFRTPREMIDKIRASLDAGGA
jgi:chromosome segregation ATPase